jgi:trigger factor
MQVVEESANGLERKIKVQVPASRIDDAVKGKLQELAKTARLNGFRPGKVPMAVVRKRFGGHVRQEVLGEVINESYQQALSQENYRPAGAPEIEPVAAEPEADGSDFEYRATFEVIPEVEIADLTGSELINTSAAVGSEDVDTMIETLRKQRTEWTDVDRAAESGDQVTMDFVGKIDGEEFAGGSAEDAPLELGSGAMIPGFEDQLLGSSSGDEKVITVNFPDDYRATELAGKEATFDIVVKAVKKPELPVVDDEFAKAFGVTEGGVDALRADIQKNMDRELEQALESMNKQAVMELLLDKNEFDVPKAMVTEESGRMRQQLQEQMQSNGGQQMDMGLEMFEQDATRRVKLGLLIAEIIKKHEIKPDPDRVRQKIESVASSYESPQQVIDYYYSNQEYMQNVEGLVLEQLVAEWVQEQASVKDRTMTFKEVMNPENNQADS